MKQTQVCIVGAGCVGLTLALGLAKQGIDVVVLDAAPEHSVPEQVSDQYSLRVSALSLASQGLLTELGAWQAIMAMRAQVYTTMDVRDKDSFGKICFAAQEQDLSHLGHIVENDVIRKALLETLANYNNASVMFDSPYQQIHQSDTDVFLTLKNGTPIIAKLLVACDGANSAIRQQYKMPLTFWDYDHHAIVATIKTQLPHNQVARQVFLPDGPLAFLPLPEANTHSIVWSTSPTKAKALMAMPDTEFNKALMSEFDGQCGLCEIVSQRQVFPLKMRYARKWLDNRVILMGDAAHTIHPLAGLGMNLGLKDAAYLLQLLADAPSSKQHEFAPHTLLRQYERGRKADAQTHIAMMQGLKELFEGQHPLKKLIRGVGLNFVDNLSPLKQLFADQALGK